MYTLIKYSSNYSATTGSLWFYSKDEATNFNADIIIILNLLNIMLNYLETLKLMEIIEFSKCNNCCTIKIFK